ncbi:hypothetical protein Tco_0379463 [Tanacetum coccineum]
MIHPLKKLTTLGSGEDSMKLNELMEMCTKLFDRVLDLKNVKDAQDLEITNLKKRGKKLEKKKKSRTPQLKRRLFKVRIESFADKSLGDQEDASKHRRNEIDQDEEISWFQEDAETQGRYGHDTEINTASTSITTASINITNDEPNYHAVHQFTICLCIYPYKNEKCKIKRDKGKGRMVEQEKPLKKKDHIKFDEELAQRLLTQLQLN